MFSLRKRPEIDLPPVSPPPVPRCTVYFCRVPDGTIIYVSANADAAETSISNVTFKLYHGDERAMHEIAILAARYGRGGSLLMQTSMQRFYAPLSSDARYHPWRIAADHSPIWGFTQLVDANPADYKIVETPYSLTIVRK